MNFTKKNTGITFNTKLLYTFLFSCFIAVGCVHPPGSMIITSEDPMVQRFYAINHEYQFWLSSKKNIKTAKEWLAVIDSAKSYGLISDKLQTVQIRAAMSNINKIDITLKEKTDQQLTGLVLHFIKDLQQSNIKFDYDEVSIIPTDSVYIYQLLNSKNRELVSKLVPRLECKDHDFLVLKKYLNDSISEKDTFKYKSVIRAMSYRRYLTTNPQSEYIVVNIPEAVARYFKKDKISIEMRAVVGKKKTPTPTIASYITTIVTFPSWNVPRSIAVKEILPKIQKNENYLEQNNFDVVDSKGNVIEDSELNWKKYTEKNFPYYFRQSTGSENALGVLKFDLKNPFSIFLHSTSWQGVFKKEYRFLSHGCIRLEKPFELTDALLRGTYNMDELKSGKKNTESGNIELPLKIPVYIIYSPVAVIDNKVTFFTDVYGLIK
jgi:murein L,D-transpeptidase YcbB/YkuD